jgi:hypothetical protein
VVLIRRLPDIKKSLTDLDARLGALESRLK